MDKNSIKAIYGATKKLLYKNGAKFKKKHGNYLVMYVPHNQVICMDTWNGRIWQGHNTEPLVDDGYSPESVYAHSSMYESNGEVHGELEIAVDIYKSALSIA